MDIPSITLSSCQTSIYIVFPHSFLFFCCFFLALHLGLIMINYKRFGNYLHKILLMTYVILIVFFPDILASTIINTDRHYTWRKAPTHQLYIHIICCIYFRSEWYPNSEFGIIWMSFTGDVCSNCIVSFNEIGWSCMFAKGIHFVSVSIIWRPIVWGILFFILLYKLSIRGNCYLNVYLKLSW